MEKAKVTRSVKAKRKTPAAQQRREMIKASAMKFASQKKVVAPVRARPPVIVKKLRKPRVKKALPNVVGLTPSLPEETLLVK